MNLKIADFTIKLFSEKPFQLEEGYLPFVDGDEACAPDVSVECVSGIPDNLLDGCKSLFEARSEDQWFYSVYEYHAGLAFRIFNQQTRNSVQQIAILNETLNDWKIYTVPGPENDLLPLKYPMGPILLYYLTVNHEAIIIHASGVFDGEKGRLFTGFSGFGKTTISNLWKESGAKLINDDRLIIRKRGNRFFMFNTPMYYPALPEEAPLDTIHLIRHAPENTTKKISGALAVSKVLAFCIQNNFDKRFIENHLDFVNELCSVTSVYETGFLPDAGIVQYVKDHE